MLRSRAPLSRGQLMVQLSRNKHLACEKQHFQHRTAPATEVGPTISDVAPTISDLAPTISDVAHTTSDVAPTMSDVAPTLPATECLHTDASPAFVTTDTHVRNILDVEMATMNADDSLFDFVMPINLNSGDVVVDFSVPLSAVDISFSDHIVSSTADAVVPDPAGYVHVSSDIEVLDQAATDASTSDVDVPDVGNFVANNIHPVHNTDLAETVNNKERQRKRKYEAARTKEWKRNIQKIRREQGIEYSNRKGKKEKPRTMGPPCTSKFCLSSKMRACQEVTEENRSCIFEYFWTHLATWTERRLYVRTLIKKNEIKQKTSVGKSRRNVSYEYYLSHASHTHRVCKDMFASTLGLAKRTVVNWLDDETHADEGSDTERLVTEVAHNALTPGEKEFVLQFLSSLATVPSHYCRQAYSHLKFLEPGTTITSLHKEYKRKTEAAGTYAASITTFSNIFHTANYSVFVPRKDQCNTCLAAKHGSIGAEALHTHITMKDRARVEKDVDKIMAQRNPSVTCWTMDMQAVLLSPRTNASCMYYKTKLKIHNFTFYCLENSDAYCYVWDETNGGLDADIFAWLQYSHFQRILQANPLLQTIIIWSDGCGYQNRNTTVSNALLHLAKTTGKTIIQKFLVSGHTQMECDSMHSTIERKITNIYSPRDYIVTMELARTSPRPYVVQQMEHHSFMTGFSGSYISSIRPGKTAGDDKVNDLRSLKYTPEGVYYQISFDERYLALPHRTKKVTEIVLSRKYQNKLPIKTKKYQDLQSLKTVMPFDVHTYYDTLPHQ